MEVLTGLDTARIAELQRRDEFFWLDLTAPDAALVDKLGELFALHPLALEDVLGMHQRPKLESYGDYVFLVFYGVSGQPLADLKLIEVHTFVSGGWIITVHPDRCAELDELRGRFARGATGAEPWIVYRILDALTDSFFPVLAAVDDLIDELEDTVVRQPDDSQLQAIFGLKRDLVSMRRAITPQRDLFARAGEEIADLPGLEPGARDYLRDVYDHLIRISDLLDSYRDLLSGAMDVYLSTVSNRLNQVMKQLTVLGTIFLPIAAITGFFGQNFGWMVKHVGSFGAFLGLGVGSLVVAIGSLSWWFARSGFLGRGDGRR